MKVRECVDWFERVLLAWVTTNRLRNEALAAGGGTSATSSPPGGSSPASPTPTPGAVGGDHGSAPTTTSSPTRPSNTPAGQDPNAADVKRVVKYRAELRQFLDVMLPAASLVADMRKERLVSMRKRVGPGVVGPSFLRHSIMWYW